MYIVDGIAYAGEQAPALKVCGVRPMQDYLLWLRFNTGESRVADCSPLLEKPAFAPLTDRDVFRDVYLDCGTVLWADGEIDIAPETLYEMSASLEQIG